MLDTMKKILWATDFSDEAEDALGYARLIADKFGSEILALHVIPEFSPVFYNIPTSFHGEMVSRMDILKNEQMNQLKEIGKKSGMSLTPLVEEGTAAKKILETAEREKVDLIVMGKRGRSIFDKLLIGSVANQVLRNSSVPVLLTRKSTAKPEWKKILVPTDFSDYEEIERDYAIFLGKHFGAELMFLHVLELHSYEFSPEALAELTVSVRQRFAGRRKPGEKELKFSDEVIRAIEAAPGITEYAEVNGFDLIVISTCGPGKWERFFLGSTTEKVISHSPVPVFAIPSHFCRS